MGTISCTKIKPQSAAISCSSTSRVEREANNCNQSDHDWRAWVGSVRCTRSRAFGQPSASTPHATHTNTRGTVHCFCGTRTPKCRWLNLVNSDIPSLVTLVGHMGPRAALSGRAGGFSCFCEELRTVRHTTHNTCSCKLWTDAHQQTTRHLVAWQHAQAAQAYNTHCTSLADRATCSQQHSKHDPCC